MSDELKRKIADLQLENARLTATAVPLLELLEMHGVGDGSRYVAISRHRIKSRDQYYCRVMHSEREMSGGNSSGSLAVTLKKAALTVAKQKGSTK